MKKREIWKFVPGYEGLYMVSNKGIVKNCRTGKILKPHKIKNGYLQVCLCKDWNKKMFLVHRLVALAFIPNPENKRTVNHKDEDKTNNCVWNLEWMTYKENNEYSDVLQTKRTPVEAYKDGELIGVFGSQHEAARQLGLFNQSINQVLKGIISQTGGYTFKYADK